MPGYISNLDMLQQTLHRIKMSIKSSELALTREQISVLLSISLFLK